MILCGSDEPGARGGFERWRDQTEVKRDGQADEGLQHTRLRLPFCPFQTESSETTNNSQSASRCINPKIPATIAATLTQPNDANDGCVRRTGKNSHRQEGFLGLFSVVSCFSRFERRTDVAGNMWASQRDFPEPFPSTPSTPSRRSS
jgi:hypothetical protein